MVATWDERDAELSTEGNTSTTGWCRELRGHVQTANLKTHIAGEKQRSELRSVQVHTVCSARVFGKMTIVQIKPQILVQRTQSKTIHKDNDS